MAKELTRGIFITFEGPEGCGKSTHSRRLFQELVSDGYEAVLTAEPGGTALGQRIREILLEKGDVHFTGRAELFLFEADRAQHVAEVIVPSLEERRLVICDRFNTATFAYQGYGLGMDIGQVEAVDAVATEGISPDLTILLDVDVGTGLQRAGLERPLDRMELRSREFHEKVRRGYIALAKNAPGKIHVLASSGDMDTVYGLVKEKVYGFIERYTGAG
ncbi:MAG: dTMP kinase [Candidatus Omnitrophica bacterium]|nr:dTMP kinase [Candidatus Omnitrophota bacterium]